LSTVAVTLIGTLARARSVSTPSWLKKPRWTVPFCTPLLVVASPNVTEPLAPAASPLPRDSVTVPV
jgi:hypothetical protein